LAPHGLTAIPQGRKVVHYIFSVLTMIAP